MRCDLAVVGAGPAGSLAARTAAAAGLEVLLVERRRQVGRPVQCAEYVPRALTRWVELPAAAVARATAELKTVLPDGEEELTRAPGFVLRREVFDRMLAEAAVAAGARLITGTRAWFGGGELRLEGGEAVEARVILGADGPTSTVGRHLGSRNRGFVAAWQERRELSREFTEPQIHFRPAFPGGYAWVFPKEGNRANIGVALEGNPRRALAEFLQTLPRGLVKRGRPLAAGGGLVPVGGMLQVLQRENLLLAGDAAGLTHPVSGAGILSAVVSGILAGRQVARALQAGDLALLAEYPALLERELGGSLRRAQAKRQEMLAGWSREGKAFRELVRRTWLAFPGYHEGG
ncbi:MAG: NAD(P)/FAD-dependent oxidoreductase [Thermaerobacter sp.]|nr:NAD(P)/FAD-dependent oxidoreductase [Thermaerobacter sp.]